MNTRKQPDSSNKLAILPMWVIDRIKEEMRLGPAAWQAITEAVEKAEVPQALPCEVKLPPGTVIGQGTAISTLMLAIQQRASYPAQAQVFSSVEPEQPHPEPIAWMVGTAFWWTKEEADRDAAETGLPIVGLGPMSGVTPEQLQGEPVAWMDPRSPHMHATISNEVKQHNLKFGGAPASAVNGYTIPLYTHADPAEVERLRLERRRMDQALSACANERDTLRTLLVEALAFLDEAYKHDIGTQLKREIKAFYLSASAEPSAPVAQA